MFQSMTFSNAAPTDDDAAIEIAKAIDKTDDNLFTQGLPADMVLNPAEPSSLRQRCQHLFVAVHVERLRNGVDGLTCAAVDDRSADACLAEDLEQRFRRLHLVRVDRVRHA